MIHITIKIVYTTNLMLKEIDYEFTYDEFYGISLTNTIEYLKRLSNSTENSLKTI